MVKLSPLLQEREFDYSDILVRPSHSDFDMKDISLRTRLTKGLSLNLPVVSSPMDTVTESKLAIALALEGGIGIIHYNLTAEEQAEHVKRVKNHVVGFIRDPKTLSPEDTIEDLTKIRERLGFDTFPITRDGASNGKLVGLITSEDYDPERHRNLKVRDRMTALEKLYHEVLRGQRIPKNIEQANERMLERRISILPYVDGKGRLVGIITKKDIEEARQYPSVIRDSKDRLLVGAAIETRNYHERLESLVEAGVDVIVIDTSHGHALFMEKMIKEIKLKYKNLQLIAGNVVDAEGTKFLIDAGADAIRVGMGPSEVCVTQQVIGVGRAQASAVYECAAAAKEYNIPVIADGGIKSPSDILKALALGAETVMIGGLFAQTEESAAPTEKDEETKGKYKTYRGMGSKGAMEKGSAVRYNLENAEYRVPEGISRRVPVSGSISDLIRKELVPGLKQGMMRVGKTVNELYERARIIENPSIFSYR